MLEALEECEAGLRRPKPEPPQACDWSSSLSSELLQEIARHAGVSSWGHLRCVCKSWRHGISLGVQTVRLTVPDRSTAFPARYLPELPEADAQRVNRKACGAARPLGRTPAIPSHEPGHPVGLAPAAFVPGPSGANTAAVARLVAGPHALQLDRHHQHPQQQQQQQSPQPGPCFAASRGRPPPGVAADAVKAGGQAVAAPATRSSEPTTGDQPSGGALAKAQPQPQPRPSVLEGAAAGAPLVSPRAFDAPHCQPSVAMAAAAAAAAAAACKLQLPAPSDAPCDSHAAGMASSVGSSSIVVWNFLESADKLTAAYPAFTDLSLGFTEPLPLHAAGGFEAGTSKWLQVEMSAALQRLLCGRLISLRLSGHTPYPLILAPPPSLQLQPGLWPADQPWSTHIHSHHHHHHHHHRLQRASSCAQAQAQGQTAQPVGQAALGEEARAAAVAAALAGAGKATRPMELAGIKREASADAGWAEEGRRQRSPQGAQCPPPFPLRRSNPGGQLQDQMLRETGVGNRVIDAAAWPEPMTVQEHRPASSPQPSPRPGQRRQMPMIAASAAAPGGRGDGSEAAYVTVDDALRALQQGAAAGDAAGDSATEAEDTGVEAHANGNVASGTDAADRPDRHRRAREPSALPTSSAAPHHATSPSAPTAPLHQQPPPPAAPVATPVSVGADAAALMAPKPPGSAARAAAAVVGNGQRGSSGSAPSHGSPESAPFRGSPGWPQPRSSPEDYLERRCQRDAYSHGCRQQGPVSCRRFSGAGTVDDAELSGGGDGCAVRCAAYAAGGQPLTVQAPDGARDGGEAQAGQEGMEVDEGACVALAVFMEANGSGGCSGQGLGSAESEGPAGCCAGGGGGFGPEGDQLPSAKVARGASRAAPPHCQPQIPRPSLHTCSHPHPHPQSRPHSPPVATLQIPTSAYGNGRCGAGKGAECLISGGSESHGVQGEIVGGGNGGRSSGGSGSGSGGSRHCDPGRSGGNGHGGASGIAAAVAAATAVPVENILTASGGNAYSRNHGSNGKDRATDSTAAATVAAAMAAATTAAAAKVGVVDGGVVIGCESRGPLSWVSEAAAAAAAAAAVVAVDARPPPSPFNTAARTPSPHFYCGAGAAVCSTGGEAAAVTAAAAAGSHRHAGVARSGSPAAAAARHTSPLVGAATVATVAPEATAAAAAAAAAVVVRPLPLLSRLSQLRSLTLVADMGFPSPQHLEAITGLRELQELDMRGAKFMQIEGEASLLGRHAWVHVGNEHVAVLARCTSLTSLSINHVHTVDGTQLTALTALTRLVALRLMDALSSNTVSGVHVQALAEGLTGLRSLEIGRVTCPALSFPQPLPIGPIPTQPGAAFAPACGPLAAATAAQGQGPQAQPPAPHSAIPSTPRPGLGAGGGVGLREVQAARPAVGSRPGAEAGTCATVATVPGARTDGGGGPAAAGGPGAGAAVGAVGGAVGAVAAAKAAPVPQAGLVWGSVLGSFQGLSSLHLQVACSIEVELLSGVAELPLLDDFSLELLDVPPPQLASLLLVLAGPTAAAADPRALGGGGAATRRHPHVDDDTAAAVEPHVHGGGGGRGAGSPLPVGQGRRRPAGGGGAAAAAAATTNPPQPLARNPGGGADGSGAAAAATAAATAALAAVRPAADCTLRRVLRGLTLTACMLYDEHLALMGRLVQLRVMRLDQVDIRTRDPDGWTALSGLRRLRQFAFREWNNPVLSACNLCLLTNDSLAMMAANWPQLQLLSYNGKVALTEKAEEHLAQLPALVSAEIAGTDGTCCRVWRGASGQLLRTMKLPYTAAKVSSRNGYVTYSDSDDSAASEGSEASVNWMGEVGYVTSEYDAD